MLIDTQLMETGKHKKAWEEGSEKEEIQRKVHCGPESPGVVMLSSRREIAHIRGMKLRIQSYTLKAIVIFKNSAKCVSQVSYITAMPSAPTNANAVTTAEGIRPFAGDIESQGAGPLVPDASLHTLKPPPAEASKSTAVYVVARLQQFPSMPPAQTGPNARAPSTPMLNAHTARQAGCA